MPRRLTSVSRRTAPGYAAQVGVQRFLDPGVAALFEIHAAQHMGRQRAVRIMALAFALDADPVQVQIAQTLRFVEWDLALDPEKAAVVVGASFHGAIESGAVEVQFRRPGCRPRLQVRNAQRD